MRIVCVSDSHMQHTYLDIPDGDILIHSGDALNRGSYAEAQRFNDWLGTLPHKYKIYVPGNHDETFEVAQEESVRIMTNAVVLIDQEVTIEGLRIYGSPWTPTFMDWNFMKSDAELGQVWQKIPDNLDVLITHGPPYGILDQNQKGEHCGSQTLYRAVIEKKPKFHVFGHIHHSSGIYKIDPTTFVNAAVLNDWYNIVANPKVFEI